MSRIALFGIGQSAKSPFVTAKQLTNLYAETRPQQPQAEKSTMVAYGTPGLPLFADFGATPPRGGLEFIAGSIAFVVHRGILWEVNNTGAMTNRGTLLTSAGRVSMDHNGLQVMIVDGTAGYIYNTNTHVFAQIVDADFPATPTSVCCTGRRFVVSLLASGRFYWSDIDNGLSWDALNFANAESKSDFIASVYTSNGQVILLGTDSCEFWGNSGVADPAFSLLSGTANEWGLAAVYSIAKYDNSFMFLGKNRTGEVGLYQMNGYLPLKKSTIDFDSIINDKTVYTSVSDATAYSYTRGGHPMYVINFPSAGYTWLFDGSSGMFSKLKSQGISRHRGEFAFNLVNKTIVADYDKGTLYTLSASELTDNGASIERELITETIADADNNFIPLNAVRLDMETGVGLTLGQGSDPQVSLSISRDNGKTWGAEMWRPMGKTGEFQARAEWRRLGSTRSFIGKFRITDPVPVTIVSASINPVN